MFPSWMNKGKPVDANTKMAEMVELSDKDFKTAIIKNASKSNYE